MSWTLREHQKEPARLSHLLYWQECLHNDTIRQKNNALMSVLRYRGPDMESADAQSLMAMHTRVHNILLTLDAGWGFHCEARRHHAEPYSHSQWNHPVAALIDEERRAQFSDGSHFETIYHFALTYHPPHTRSQWFRDLWWEHTPETNTNVDEIA